MGAYNEVGLMFQHKPQNKIKYIQDFPKLEECLRPRTKFASRLPKHKSPEIWNSLSHDHHSITS